MNDPSGVERARIESAVRNRLAIEIRKEIITRLRSFGTVTVLPRPALSSGGLGNQLVSLEFNTGIGSTHFLYKTCGLAGTAAFATRQQLVRQDRAALTFHNVTVLQCLFRPAVSAALGLLGSPLLPAPLAGGSGGFVEGHPLLFIGPPRGIRLSLRTTGVASLIADAISRFDVSTAIAGIDGTNIRLLFRIVATGAGDAFVINADVDQRFTLLTSRTGSALTVTIAPLGAPVVTSDIAVSPWAYVLALVWGGPLYVALAAIADGLTGRNFNLPFAAAVAGLMPTVTASLQVPFEFTGIRSISLFQSDSVTRTIPLGGGADLFPAHDCIVNLN